jgi:hypothetical protein
MGHRLRHRAQTIGYQFAGLGGFSFGLLLHTLAALVWAGTAAVGHAFFGWRLPPLRLPERPSSEKRE